MKLIKYTDPDNDDKIAYGIANVSATDLAAIQLALISVGEEALKTDEDWRPSQAKTEYGRTLTINQAGLLGDLIRGVERGLKMRYYQFGTRDTDHPMVVVLRAFTYGGGGFYPHDADIRDSYVWTSGFTERWFRVNDLITALDNLDGKHGEDNPIAVMDKE